MFKSRYLIALVVFSLAGIVAQCDPIDPVMSMDDPPTAVPVGLGFGFSSNVSGGGYLAFQNASGIPWSIFDVFVTLPLNSVITCSGGTFFNSCTPVAIPEGGGIALYDVEFRNLSTVEVVSQQATGVVAGASFTINLNDLVNGVQPTDPNGSGGWGANNSFTALANGAPEPASWLLLTAGGALLLVVRKRARRIAR